MQLYLQFGFGMMAHTRELLSQGAGAGVVLSPRDLEPGQIERVAKDARDAGAEPLLDPQCFARDADHERLVSHAYWQQIKEHATGAFTGGAGTDAMLADLAGLARAAGITRHILPAFLADPVSDDWFRFQEAIMGAAPRHFGDEPLLATIALSSTAILDEAQIETVIEHAESWAVSGFYVVAETPGAYLVDDPVWLANLLILVSGLKLLGKYVLVGYCNHQMLCLASANADAMASGTWLNVRAFPPSKFYVRDDDEVSRRATWFYCPQALSEYKLPFLGIAQSVGALEVMKPPRSLGSRFADALFTGVVPTSVKWGEHEAFRHYLTSLNGQVTGAPVTTFDEAVAGHGQLLDAAEKVLKKLKGAGVRGGDRDFGELIDVNRGAIAKYTHARGARMRRSW